MTQKSITQAMTLMGTFNQSGNISNDEGAKIAEIDYAQMRLESRKRIIRNLRLGRRYRGNESGLARVREANQSGVGQELQLELQLPFFAVASFLVIARSTIRRSSKVRVAKSSATSPRRQPALSIFGKVKEQFVRDCVENLRADWDADDYVFAFLSRSIATLTVHAATRHVQRVVAQV